MPNKEAKGKLFIPEKFPDTHIFVNMDSVSLSAGHRAQSVKIELSPNLKDNELMISQDVIELLSIPEDIKYQVRFMKDGIELGPVIGLLMARDIKSLTKRRLKAISSYTMIYPEIQGLIVAMSAEGIDFKNKLVEGYYYNPDSTNKKIAWKQGLFPLPDAIFQRIDIPESVRVKLKENTNNRLFNSYYFDKWEFWNKLSKVNQVSMHVPHTTLLSSLKDIDSMLSKYDSVYLKPLNGTLSRGIYKVNNKDNSYVFKDSQGNNTLTTSLKSDAENFVRNITSNHRYLIQQALHPITIEGRHIDFRVIMQKDHTMKWVCPGIVAFLGKPGDICSNWGYVTTFEELLAKDFNLSQDEIFRKRQEVIGVCRDVCEVLDVAGENYGDLGFDVLLDQSFKVWILESNKRHYHSVPLWNNDVLTFYEVKANPIKYASALSGFCVY